MEPIRSTSFVLAAALLLIAFWGDASSAADEHLIEIKECEPEIVQQLSSELVALNGQITLVRDIKSSHIARKKEMLSNGNCALVFLGPFFLIGVIICATVVPICQFPFMVLDCDPFSNFTELRKNGTRYLCFDADGNGSPPIWTPLDPCSPHIALIAIWPATCLVACILSFCLPRTKLLHSTKKCDGELARLNIEVAKVEDSMTRFIKERPRKIAQLLVDHDLNKALIDIIFEYAKLPKICTSSSIYFFETVEL